MKLLGRLTKKLMACVFRCSGISRQANKKDVGVRAALNRKSAAGDHKTVAVWSAPMLRTGLAGAKKLLFERPAAVK